MNFLFFMNKGWDIFIFGGTILAVYWVVQKVRGVPPKLSTMTQIIITVIAYILIIAFIELSVGGRF